MMSQKKSKITTDLNKRKVLKLFLMSHNAFDMKHTGRCLGDHLLGTYDLLEEAGCNEDVRLAGGLHSIYGTNAYKSCALGEKERPFIQGNFGVYTENLVWTFHSVNRPRAIEEAIEERDVAGVVYHIEKRDGEKLKCTTRVLEDLMMIEAANLIEQGSNNLYKYPRIKEHWETHNKCLQLYGPRTAQSSISQSQTDGKIQKASS